MNNLENHMALPDYEELPMRQDEDGSYHFDYERTCEPEALSTFMRVYPEAYDLIESFYDKGITSMWVIPFSQQIEIAKTICEDNPDVITDIMFDSERAVFETLDILSADERNLIKQAEFIKHTLVKNAFHHSNAYDVFDLIKEWRTPTD